MSLLWEPRTVEQPLFEAVWGLPGGRGSSPGGRGSSPGGRGSSPGGRGSSPGGRGLPAQVKPRKRGAV